MSRSILFVLAGLLIANSSKPLFGQSGSELKVFVLAGQSNMEGKGSVETLKRQLKDPNKAAMFLPLIKDGDFFSRPDVRISYLGWHGVRVGDLEIGYATSRENDRRMFGPELGFGWAVGDRLKDDVLIIKTAWGGKSIDRDFRPPSRGYPDSLNQYFENKQKRNPEYTIEHCKQEYGHYYRLMIEHVKKVLADEKSKTNGRQISLAGFVWFQGFNDQFAPTSVEDYKDNLVAFINDVRSDLSSPQLPFVIGAMGHGGEKQRGKIAKIANAQVATSKSFPDGSVVTIRTAQFWDDDADAAFDKYWRDKDKRVPEKWKDFGGDRPFHYHGSPRFFWQAGQSFGNAALEFIDAND